MESFQKYDGRDIRKATYAYQEVEFFSVFVPLIGSDAAWIYTVMTRLLPQAGINEYFELTTRTIASAAGLVKLKKNRDGSITQIFNTAAVHRGLGILTAVGMLKKRPNIVVNRAATYYLVTLSDLAKLGTEALQKRLIGVSGGNTEGDDTGTDGAVEPAADDAADRAGRDDSHAGEPKVGGNAGEAPAASELIGVSGGNTEANEARNLDSDESVFQKGGVGVSPEGIGVSPEGIGVSKTASSIKSKANHTLIPPYPPEGGSEGDDLVLPFEDPRPGGAGWVECAAIAARWVMRKFGEIRGRVEPEIAKAMGARLATNRDETLVQVAHLMAQRYATYLADHAAGRMRYPNPLGFAKFIAGGYWLDTRRWGYDQARQEATVGVAPATDAEREQDEMLKLTTWMEQQAAAAEAVGFGVVAQLVRLLGAQLIAGEIGIGGLDAQLCELEEQMFASLLYALGGEERAALQTEARAMIEPFKKNLPTPQRVSEALNKAMQKKLSSDGRLPRLSLYYMP